VNGGTLFPTDKLSHEILCRVDIARRACLKKIMSSMGFHYVELKFQLF
jgi:hypothetical protein